MELIHIILYAKFVNIVINIKRNKKLFVIINKKLRKELNKIC
jgi:hypothetical protein